MIFATGIDIVQVDRIKRWERFSYDQLCKIFSQEELSYCKFDDSYNWPCLAARFAAKEAFFKALSAMFVKFECTKVEFSFMFLCKYVFVSKTTWDVPILVVDWKAIEKKIGTKLSLIQIDLSISHEQCYAIAHVILYC